MGSRTKTGRGGLEDSPFAYQAGKDGRVVVSWRGKPVATLKAARAERFLRRLSGMDDMQRQLEMAKVTGNFKRGNEGQARS
jgi:hypothetical protein